MTMQQDADMQAILKHHEIRYAIAMRQITGMLGQILDCQVKIAELEVLWQETRAQLTPTQMALSQTEARCVELQNKHDLMEQAYKARVGGANAGILKRRKDSQGTPEDAPLLNVSDLPTPTHELLGDIAFVGDSDQPQQNQHGLQLEGGGCYAVEVHCTGTLWEIAKLHGAK